MFIIVTGMQVSGWLRPAAEQIHLRLFVRIL